MAKLNDGLKWNWKDVTKKGRENFLEAIAKVPITILRSGKNSETEKNNLLIDVYSRSNRDFIVSPNKGTVQYILTNFSWIDLEDISVGMSYNPKGSLVDELNSHETFKIGNAHYGIHFLTKPLDNPER